MKQFLSVLCAFSFFQCVTNASKILAIFPFQAKSHYAPFEPLVKRLAEKGHELKVISHYPQDKKIQNFIDVDISSSLPKLIGNVQFSIVENLTIWKNAKFMWENAGSTICRPVFDHPEVNDLIKSDETFDLVISEIFVTDCFLGFVHKFNAPYVGVSSSVALPWIPHDLNNPDNPSYIPQFFSRFSDRMNYWQRFMNSVYLLALKIGHQIYSDKLSHDIAKDYFGSDLPSLNDLRSKVGLVLVNGHHSVSSPRALTPGVKEVGGIHIPISGPSKLPRDLKKYLDSAEEGVVYLSMGSQLNSTSFPDKNMAILRQVFAELPERVLWKCEEREMPQLPRNVKCLDWAPQLSVLCHPNVKVFFSHGGLLGTQEAIYCGVPILGMPLFADQFTNIAHGVDQGYALKVDFHDPSYEELFNNLKLLLTNSSYSKRAKEASDKFRDRPLAPLDEAVFWVEYLLRHGPGALRTAASELAWYQYLLLDVVAGVCVSLFAVIFVLNKLLSLILSGKKTERNETAMTVTNKEKKN